LSFPLRLLDLHFFSFLRLATVFPTNPLVGQENSTGKLFFVAFSQISYSKFLSLQPARAKSFLRKLVLHPASEDHFGSQLFFIVSILPECSLFNHFPLFPSRAVVFVGCIFPRCFVKPPNRQIDPQSSLILEYLLSQYPTLVSVFFLVPSFRTSFSSTVLPPRGIFFFLHFPLILELPVPHYFFLFTFTGDSTAAFVPFSRFLPGMIAHFLFFFC